MNGKISDYPNVSVITLIIFNRKKIKTQSKINKADRTQEKSRQICNHDFRQMHNHKILT